MDVEARGVVGCACREPRDGPVLAVTDRKVQIDGTVAVLAVSDRQDVLVRLRRGSERPDLLRG